ncbi:putative calmodulin-like protein 5-like [Capsicum annuum]|nr:putative calmodulin-like protein 5-like [Capsicum annuum]
MQLAVLAGDFLLSRACVALASKNTEVVSLLATVVEHLVTGETMQMTTSSDERCRQRALMRASEALKLICHKSKVRVGTVSQEGCLASWSIKDDAFWRSQVNFRAPNPVIDEKSLWSEGKREYVDDIIFGSTNMNMTHDFAKLMSCEFETSMIEEVNFFLGLQIKQTTSGTMIHQQKYVKELFKRFSMKEAKEISTPIATTTKLNLDETGLDVEKKLYRGMIRSLLYLKASRPDIIFSMGLCTRFQENLKESHLKSMKRIFKYLKGISDLGLWYPKGGKFNLVGYSDADYAGYLVDRKSTMSMTHFLGSCLVTWSTKKQNSVALLLPRLNMLLQDLVVLSCYGLNNN